MNKILMGMIILFAYVFLSPHLTMYNVVFGMGITLIILKIMPAKVRRVQVGSIFKAFMAFGSYVLLTAKNTILGGIQVAKIVLSPNMPLNSGIIAVDADCEHELGQALSAHSISLSPGEFLVEAHEDGTMYIHSLDVDQTEKVTREEQKYRRNLLNLLFGEKEA